MDFETYLQLAPKTANTDLDRQTRLWAATLGLVDESIELTAAIAEVLDGRADIEGGRANIRDEIGDMAWYAVELAGLLGVELNEPPAGLTYNRTADSIMEICMAMQNLVATRVGEPIKKKYAHNHPLDESALVRPLDNTLVLLAQIGAEAGLKFADVLERNIEKLAARHGERFSALANR